MNLREDCHLHNGYCVVLLCENGSFSLRDLKSEQGKSTYLTRRIPVAEADLLRLAQDEMESYDVMQDGVRLTIHTGRVAIVLGGSNAAEAFGGRMQFGLAATKLLRSAGIRAR